MTMGHYEGFGKLRDTALHIAAFLEATANHPEKNENYPNRLRHCAQVLRESEKEATELYYERTK